jgi:hypothetical protein
MLVGYKTIIPFATCTNSISACPRCGPGTRVVGGRETRFAFWDLTLIVHQRFSLRFDPIEYRNIFPTRSQCVIFAILALVVAPCRYSCTRYNRTTYAYCFNPTFLYFCSIRDNDVSN